MGCLRISLLMGFQHTAARRRLPARCYIMSHHSQVSTHSRPKAAASRRSGYERGLSSFNTQPRGGGCDSPEISFDNLPSVSTHSRAEAAANTISTFKHVFNCFNTQPRGGGCISVASQNSRLFDVSTHSRAEAAAYQIYKIQHKRLFQHTAARRRLLCLSLIHILISGFQHTAARRRLQDYPEMMRPLIEVSTHSRAEAAAI